MTPIRDYVRSLFPVQPGERARVALMFLYSLFAIGGVLIAGRAISTALFLSMLPQSLTPFKYILPPVFIMATAALYTRMTPRYEQSRLIMGTSLLMTSGVLLFRLLLETPYGSDFWVLAGFYVYMEMAAMLVGVQFWTFAAEMFTTREARRLLGTITLGGILANSVSGIGLRVASAYVLPQDLLLVVAAGLVGSVLCVRALEKRRPQTKAEKQLEEDFPPLRQLFGEMRSSKLILAIGAIVVVLGMVAMIVEYQLDLTLQRFFSADGQAMLAFLGGFQFLVGIAGIIVQLFATNHTLARFGLVIALLVLPIAIGAGSGTILLTGGLLWAVALTRGATLSFRYSLNDVALNILYMPIPVRLRRQAKTVLDGVVKPPILGLLGVLFLLVMNDDIDLVGVQASDVVPWSYAVLALLAVWVVLVYLARREYTLALAQSLRRRRLSIVADGLDLRDETTAKVLEQSLSSEDEARVVYALNILGAAPSQRWDAAVAPLFVHPSSAVQTAALQYAELSRNAALIPKVEKLLDANESPVRATAISTYCLFLGSECVDRVLPMLDDDAVSVQAAAITGLIRNGGTEGILQGAAVLQAMADSEDSAIRCKAADILGELGIASFYQPLVPLMEDEDVQVVRAAIGAAGRVRHSALIPLMVTKLGERSSAYAARRALVEYGPGVESDLEQTMADVDGCHAAIRRQIPIVLGQIETEQSAATLMKYVDDDDRITRGNVLSGLHQLAKAGVPYERSQSVLARLLMAEIQLYYREVAVWEDLGVSGRGDLLADALERNHARTLSHIFDVLHLLYPEHEIELIHDALRADDRSVRANAIELLDMIMEQEVSYVMVPIMEANNARLLEIGESVFGIERHGCEERLGDLATDSEAWMRSCALYQIGVLYLDSLAGKIEEATECEFALVRETSLVAGKTILDQSGLQAIIERYAASDPDPQVRRYAMSLKENGSRIRSKFGPHQGRQ